MPRSTHTVRLVLGDQLNPRHSWFQSTDRGVVYVLLELQTVILSLLSCAASAFLARRERPGFYLLVAATGSVLAVALITVFGNIPINNQIKTWSITAPPASWVERSAQWWQFQTMRTIAAVCGMALLIVVVLMRRSGPSER